MFPHDDLNDELRDAVEELVAAVEATAKPRENDLKELTVAIWAADTVDEAWEAMCRAMQLGWIVDPHATTPDIDVVADAADQLNRRLEH